jgi:hypothetical protein
VSSNDNFLDRKIHKALAERLLAVAEDPESTAAQLSVVRQFLSDNGINRFIKDGEAAQVIRSLTENLPFESADQEEEMG